ncbi:MAG TPA: hypothetical protein VIE64_00480 [Solirubrobacterales bacterium]|jgi:hypothetical protein
MRYSDNKIGSGEIDCTDRPAESSDGGPAASPLRVLCNDGAFGAAAVRSLERLGSVAELNGEPVNGDALVDLMAQSAVLVG